jgi:hypothetical protein
MQRWVPLGETVVGTNATIGVLGVAAVAIPEAFVYLTVAVVVRLVAHFWNYSDSTAGGELVFPVVEHARLLALTAVFHARAFQSGVRLVADAGSGKGTTLADPAAPIHATVPDGTTCAIR